MARGAFWPVTQGSVSLCPGGLLLESVAELSARIHRDFAYMPGFTSVTTPLSVVLEHRRGVCQDFAHLAIACLQGNDSRTERAWLSPFPGSATKSWRHSKATRL